ncbi:MAG: retron system putative HNH endonuclease [Pseudomonadota bacterium]
MRSITKGREPGELTQYRRQKDACYDGPLFTEVKDAVRRQLLREQGHLCAYCMQRISAVTMKVEHWHCRSKYPCEGLDYGNMLAVCHGNEGSPSTQQNCDTAKGDKELKYNPADSTHDVERLVNYYGDGRIGSNDPVLREQLDDVLNLNQSRLRRDREQVVDAVRLMLGRDRGSRSAAEIRRLRDGWSAPDKEGKLKEYCGVAVYLLNKRLNRRARR